MLEIMLLNGSAVKAGQALFEKLGDNVFVVPNGLTSISAATVGRGVGGGGGLSYRSDIPVTPGETLIVRHTLTQSSIYRGSNLLLIAYAGTTQTGGNGGKSANVINDGGGNGGNGAGVSSQYVGGGAGGYSGNGGRGAIAINTAGIAGTGGAGGGGGWFGTFGNGGGVLLTGATGFSGAGGDSVVGVNGGQGSTPTSRHAGVQSYGGGNWDGKGTQATTVFNGATRIIWGKNRHYPSTNCGDV